MDYRNCILHKIIAHVTRAMHVKVLAAKRAYILRYWKGLREFSTRFMRTHRYRACQYLVSRFICARILLNRISRYFANRPGPTKKTYELVLRSIFKPVCPLTSIAYRIAFDLRRIRFLRVCVAPNEKRKLR